MSERERTGDGDFDGITVERTNHETESTMRNREQWEIDRLVRIFQDAWHDADAEGEAGRRTDAGIRAVLADIDREAEHNA